MPKITYLEENNTNLTPQRTFRKSFLAVLLIVSFLMGAAGGTGALVLFSSSNYLKEKLGINLDSLKINKTETTKLVLEESSAVIESTNKVSPAVVSIATSKIVTDFFGAFEQNGGGTGFIIENDGLIITNKHVVQGGDYLKVTTDDGKTYDAKLVATDPTNDLALLKIDASGLPVVNLGDSDSLQIGQWVIAVGNALGELQNTVTVGVISARERQLTAGSGTQQEQLNNLLQTDAAINPGNSGGPLVNLKGQVIGINTAIAGDAEGIGFAIPINQAKIAIDSYKKNGKIIKPALGVRYLTLNKELAARIDVSVDYGAIILARSGESAVVSGSAADKAGLKSRDVILAINDERVDEKHPLSVLVNKYTPNQEVELKYLRDGQEKTVKVKLGAVE